MASTLGTVNNSALKTSAVATHRSDTGWWVTVVEELATASVVVREKEHQGPCHGGRGFLFQPGPGWLRPVAVPLGPLRVWDLFLSVERKGPGGRV